MVCLSQAFHSTFLCVFIFEIALAKIEDIVQLNEIWSRKQPQ